MTEEIFLKNVCKKFDGEVTTRIELGLIETCAERIAWAIFRNPLAIGWSGKCQHANTTNGVCKFTKSIQRRMLMNI